MPGGNHSRFARGLADGHPYLSDGDGDFDLAVGGFFTVNRVYANVDGELTSAWVPMGPASEAGTRSLAWGDWDGDGDDDVGVFRVDVFYLDANGNGRWDGAAGGDLQIPFGELGDTPIVGDWDGDGDDDVGVHRGREFLLDGNGDGVYEDGVDPRYRFGIKGDTPLAGDWDGDGISTPGLYRQSDGFFYARDSNTQGPADTECFAGNPQDVPLSGDWDGDGDDNLGIYRPSEQMFYLFTTTCTGSPMGAAQISFLFGTRRLGRNGCSVNRQLGESSDEWEILSR